MAIPDNRIRLSPTKIDFQNDVGTTGQDHDDYPAPGQARFDHMRIFLIGLLSQQSSATPPSQFRQGTPWLDTSQEPPELKIRIDNQWVPYADAIRVGEGQESMLLSEWFQQAKLTLDAFAPDVTFSGRAASSVASVAIPVPLRSSITDNSRPLVYINGLLLDPRDTSIDGNSVSLGIYRMKTGDRFTVLIRGIPSQNFYVPDVPAP